MKRSLNLGLLCLFSGLLFATAPAGTQNRIAHALLAAPPSISARAGVFDIDSKGKVIVLRRGTNGFSCYVGAPGIGNDPFCANEPAMQWVADWMNHKKAPTNTKPGIMYMLLGGTDWSATDPWATKGTPIHEPPHWMILYPYVAAATYEKSGLSKTSKTDGTWIMWAGTPYAHLMINQHP